MELSNNRDGGVSGDELTSPDGSSERRHKFSVNQIHELERYVCVSFPNCFTYGYVHY